MIDFSLTEEQIALRTLVREFCEREVKPLGLEYDQKGDPGECFPWVVVEKSHQAGLNALALKKEYGGADIDTLTGAILVEEASAAESSFGALLQQIWKVTKIIQMVGTRQQQERFLFPLRHDPRFHFGIGLTEPEAGSDNFMNPPDPKAGLKLSAEVKGDEVILNGMKHFISFGNTASVFIVFARTDKSKPLREGLSLFVVDKDAPGLTVGRIHNRMGIRLMSQSELIFENCRIPRANQLGGWNNAADQVVLVVRFSNAWTACICLGIARACFEKAVEYAKSRVQGAVPIIKHSNTAIHLGEMFMKLEAARYIIWKACWNADNADYFDPRMIKVPKVFVSEVAKDIAISAMEIHGGLGVMKEVGMEKLVRDALTLLHPDGPNDSLLIYAGHMIEQGVGPRKA